MTYICTENIIQQCDLICTENIIRRRGGRGERERGKEGGRGERKEGGREERERGKEGGREGREEGGRERREGERGRDRQQCDLYLYREQYYYNSVKRETCACCIACIISVTSL